MSFTVRRLLEAIMPSRWPTHRNDTAVGPQTISPQPVHVFLRPPSMQIAQGGGSSPLMLQPAILALALPDAAIDFTGNRTFIPTPTSVAISVLNTVGSGWFDPVPSSDTIVTYIATTGNDTNNGLSQGFPKRTIAAGYAALRNGFPDWLLFDNTQTWTEVPPAWHKSGRSSTERMILWSWDPLLARPVIQTGTSTALQKTISGQGSNLAIMGLEFFAHTYNGLNGIPVAIDWQNNSSNLLVEDCYLHNYCKVISLDADGGGPFPSARQVNSVVRRCVIADAHNTNGGNLGAGNPVGIYSSNQDGMIIEENVFDRNGWGLDGSIGNQYRRNLYLSNLEGHVSTGMIVRKNIVAGTDGLQLRSGGLCEENLFVRNAIAIFVGGEVGPNAGQNVVTPIQATVRRNCILDGGDLSVAEPRGWALSVQNIDSGLIEWNLIAHNSFGHSAECVQYRVHSNGCSARNAIMQKCVVYDWGELEPSDLNTGHYFGVMLRFHGDAASTTNFQMIDNDLQNPIDHGGDGSDRLIAHNDAGSCGTGHVTTARNRYFCLNNSFPGAGFWFNVVGSSDDLATYGTLVQDGGTSTELQVSYRDPTVSLESYHVSLGQTGTFDAFMAQARLQSRANWRPQYTAKAVNDYLRFGFNMENAPA
jgi:hypothetical protein